MEGSVFRNICPPGGGCKMGPSSCRVQNQNIELSLMSASVCQLATEHAPFLCAPAPPARFPAPVVCFVPVELAVKYAHARARICSRRTNPIDPMTPINLETFHCHFTRSNLQTPLNFESGAFKSGPDASTRTMSALVYHGTL